jgi:hypothetical protein
VAEYFPSVVVVEIYVSMEIIVAFYKSKTLYEVFISTFKRNNIIELI